MNFIQLLRLVRPVPTLSFSRAANVEVGKLGAIKPMLATSPTWPTYKNNSAALVAAE